MTSRSISLGTDTFIDAPFLAPDLIIPSLRPFIGCMAAEIANGISVARAARRAACKYPTAAEHFSIGGASQETAEFLLDDALTFSREDVPSRLIFGTRLNSMSVPMSRAVVCDWRQLLGTLALRRATLPQLFDDLDDSLAAVVGVLLERGMIVEGTSGGHALRKTPGITRLQHAGLLFRGRRVGLMVDPHLHSPCRTSSRSEDFASNAFVEGVEVILITHGHRDHWHVPTLMMFPRDIAIVVPKVARPSMLSPDFGGVLRSMGFTRVMTLGWNDAPLVFDDVEVTALPFYGEQPLLREAPRHPDLRNEGNTYVLRQDAQAYWILCDSGADVRGDMLQVAEMVRKRFGPIDILISNLREFYIGSPHYITGGHYWLALTVDQLNRFRAMSGHKLTLGPDGVAAICKAVGARVFLPYAHWWGTLGEDGGNEEHMLLEALSRRLVQIGSVAKVVPWKIGSTYFANADRVAMAI